MEIATNLFFSTFISFCCHQGAQAFKIDEQMFLQENQTNRIKRKPFQDSSILQNSSTNNVLVEGENTTELFMAAASAVLQFGLLTVQGLGPTCYTTSVPRLLAVTLGT